MDFIDFALIAVKLVTKCLNAMHHFRQVIVLVILVGISRHKGRDGNNPNHDTVNRNQSQASIKTLKKTLQKQARSIATLMKERERRTAAQTPPGPGNVAGTSGTAAGGADE